MFYLKSEVDISILIQIPAPRPPPPLPRTPPVACSLFEERLPIGLMEVIKTVTPETVRAFYARNYHPERMAVIAVGDFPDGGNDMVRN